MISVFALAVATESGFELSGNAVAVHGKLVVTAFHNIFDEVPVDYDKSTDSEKYILFREELNMDNKFVISRIFKYAIITQSVIRVGSGEEYKNPILVKFVDGDYKDDWVVLEVVSNVSSHNGMCVVHNPVDFRFPSICMGGNLPKAGLSTVKGYHFDIVSYRASSDEEETLSCQLVEYSQVIMYKDRSRVYRVKNGLGFGSCGSPYFDKDEQLVAIHLASLDSTAVRQPKIRFRTGQSNRGKRAKLTHNNLKCLTQYAGLPSDAVLDEQDEFNDEISSMADSYTTYKEGFVLCQSSKFMQLLKNH